MTRVKCAQVEQVLSDTNKRSGPAVTKSRNTYTGPAATKVNDTNKRSGTAAIESSETVVPVDLASSLWRVMVLTLWFVTSWAFNYLTPQFEKHVKDAAGATDSEGITMIELLSSVAYGLVVLPSCGLAVLPPRHLLYTLAKVGLAHLATCRLFVVAVCGDDRIPVSLAQTIRAANPLFTVIFMFLVYRRTVRTSVLLSLAPLILGFALAAMSELSFNLIGFLAAVGSVTLLVVVNLVSKGLLDGTEKDGRQDRPVKGSLQPHWAQIQLWSCAFASMFLLPFWVFNGGHTRTTAALYGDGGTRFAQLIVVNGLMYYAEQTLQTLAISCYSSLTLSVIDTIRRLSIVVVSGYIMQGNSWTYTNVFGVALVMLGGLLYTQCTSKCKGD